MNTKDTRREGLDKFYTKPEIAKACISRIKNWDSWDLVIEPSAGNGNFFKHIPTTKKIAIDIKPGCDSVIEKDFFKYVPKPGKILVIGNPPFGKRSLLAVKFFNHAALWADTVAFIVPRTFRRTSVQNKLDMSFHLSHDEDIPIKPCAFEPPMTVKCCFQIWQRRGVLRTPIHLPITHRDWEFLQLGPKDDRNQPTPPTGADFAILAYGGKCGKIQTNGLEKLRPKSWHWIRANIDKTVLMRRFEKLDYSMSENTARQNSIGKAELIQLYDFQKNSQ